MDARQKVQFGLDSLDWTEFLSARLIYFLNELAFIGHWARSEVREWESCVFAFKTLTSHFFRSDKNHAKNLSKSRNAF